MAHTESSGKSTTATLTIDGRQVTVPAGATILEAAWPVRCGMLSCSSCLTAAPMLTLLVIVMISS